MMSVAATALGRAAEANAGPDIEARLDVWLKRLRAITTLLVLTGLAMCFSTTAFLRIALERSPYRDFFQQLVFCLIGMTLAWVIVHTVGRFRPARRWLRFVIPVAFVLSLVLVAMVKFSPFGVTVMGSTRFLDFGFVKFQPSELLKISLVMYLAQVLCWYRRLPDTSYTGEAGEAPECVQDVVAQARARRDPRPQWPALPKRCIAVILVALGLTVIQPDLGTTSIVFGSGIITMVLAGVSWRQLGLFVGGLALAILIAFAIFPSHFDYAKDRLYTWAHPLDDTDGKAYQITQSRGAIAAGGLWGRGYLQSDQKMNRLPLSTKDFVYPVIIEELGYVGGVVVIGLFLYLAWVGKCLAMTCRDPFNRTVIAALGFTICLQAFVNIGTTLGTLPLTGITLPFYSDGGTSMVVTLMAIGFMYGLAKSELPPARRRSREAEPAQQC